MVAMAGRRMISIVGCHCEGEVGDVIVGGVRDVPGDTMLDKLVAFASKHDNIRQFLLNEPRGRGSMNINLLLRPCNPLAEAGFLTMGNEEYAFMSGSNTICTTTVLLETGMIPMEEPETNFALDTAAGLITVTAQCSGGQCKSVSFDNVPSFVGALDLQIKVPGIGVVSVDVAFGGMWYAIVDAASIGLKVENSYCTRLIEVGNMVLRCVQEQYTPVHPENPKLSGVSMISITEPVRREEETGQLVGSHCVLVPPGRCDRSPCGTGTSARLAVLHERGLIQEGEPFVHQSIIKSKFVGKVQRTTKVGGRNAIIPSITGRAWITGYKQVVLDPSDPYPVGFRVGDHWVMN